MCKHCIGSYQKDRMRKEPLDENELAMFKRLQTLDPKKLAARLPAWIKTHNRLTAAPKPFVFKPNQPPVFPSWITNCGARYAPPIKIPSAYANTPMDSYIRSFEILNNLISTS